jgi:hypothetical protein
LDGPDNISKAMGIGAGSVGGFSEMCCWEPLIGLEELKYGLDIGVCRILPEKKFITEKKKFNMDLIELSCDFGDK